MSIEELDAEAAGEAGDPANTAAPQSEAAAATEAASEPTEAAAATAAAAEQTESAAATEAPYAPIDHEHEEHDVLEHEHEHDDVEHDHDGLEFDAHDEDELHPPRTRVCRVCSVEINAASARCPYCRARQFKHQPLLGWRGLCAMVVAVAAAVVITRAVIDAENSGLRYVSFDTVNLAAFVPAGWENQVLSGPHGTALAGYVSKSSSADTLTIKAVLAAPGSPHSREVGLYEKLATAPGVARGYHGTVTLPGDDVRWSLYYSLDGAYYAVFFSDACRGTVGMTVTLSSSSPTRLDEYAQTVPGGAAPKCDGPTFSARHRADPSVPLAPQ